MLPVLATKREPGIRALGPGLGGPGGPRRGRCCVGAQLAILSEGFGSLRPRPDEVVLEAEFTFAEILGLQPRNERKIPMHY